MARKFVTNIRGQRGPQGVQGIPGGTAASNDAATAEWIATPGTSQTQTAGDGRWGRTRTDPREDGGYDVILVAGQSNAQGCGTPFNAALDIAIPGIDQYACSGPNIGTVVSAIDPLLHPAGAPAGAIGAVMEFARSYWRDIRTNRKILIVPVAVGATSFGSAPDYSWDYDNVSSTTNLAKLAIQRATEAVNLSAKNRLVAIIWQQGESDRSLTPAFDYYAKLSKVLREFRAQIPTATNTPILVGSMVPKWIQADHGPRGEIDSQHRAIPWAFPRSVYVSGPTESAMSQDADIHYSALGAREMGRRLYTAFTLIDNTLPRGFSDDFNRRTQFGLGLTPAGKPWVLDKTAGSDISLAITQNSVTVVSGATTGIAMAVIDGESSAGTLTATLRNAGGDRGGLIIRGVDLYNHLFLDVRNGVDPKYVLQKRVVGATTPIFVSTAVPVTGDKIEVLLDGTSIIVKVNTVQIMSQTVTDFKWGTLHGMFFYPTGGLRMDDISFAPA